MLPITFCVVGGSPASLSTIRIGCSFFGGGASSLLALSVFSTQPFSFFLFGGGASSLLALGVFSTQQFTLIVVGGDTSSLIALGASFVSCCIFSFSSALFPVGNSRATTEWRQIPVVGAGAGTVAVGSADAGTVAVRRAGAGTVAVVGAGAGTVAVGSADAGTVTVGGACITTIGKLCVRTYR